MITLFVLHLRDRLCFVIVSALECLYCFFSVVLMKIFFSHKCLFCLLICSEKNAYIWIEKCKLL